MPGRIWSRLGGISPGRGGWGLGRWLPGCWLGARVRLARVRLIRGRSARDRPGRGRPRRDRWGRGRWGRGRWGRVRSGPVRSGPVRSGLVGSGAGSGRLIRSRLGGPRRPGMTCGRRRRRCRAGGRPGMPSRPRCRRPRCWAWRMPATCRAVRMLRTGPSSRPCPGGPIRTAPGNATPTPAMRSPPFTPGRALVHRPTRWRAIAGTLLRRSRRRAMITTVIRLLPRRARRVYLLSGLPERTRRRLPQTSAGPMLSR